jgi:hypothetical protein
MILGKSIDGYHRATNSSSNFTRRYSIKSSREGKWNKINSNLDFSTVLFNKKERHTHTHTYISKQISVETEYIKKKRKITGYVICSIRLSIPE